MPYIPTILRRDYDGDIDAIVTALRFIPQESRHGATNYVVSRIVLGTLKPDCGWSYHSLSCAIAVLRDAAHEIERRLMDEREDRAIKINGDLPEYERP